MALDSYYCLLPRAYRLCSFDHPIRSSQHVGRNRQADLLGGFQIDDKFKLRRLLNGQICGLGSLKNLVYKNGGAPEEFGLVSSVGHQAIALNKISSSAYRR